MNICQKKHRDNQRRKEMGLTKEMIKENMKRMQEILDNRSTMEKINWKIGKMSNKANKNSCILCGLKAIGLGMFLLHKSKNQEYGLKEGEERLYLYYVCETHLDDVDSFENETIFKIEDKLKNDNCHNSQFIEVQ